MGCSAESVAYERADDEDIYEEVLGEFEAYMEAAEAAEDINTRFILEAQAEAYLLNSADFIPEALMAEISIVGGLLLLSSGLSILKIKDLKTVNMLPALAVPVLFYILKGLLG